MDSTVFKYNKHSFQQQQNEHFNSSNYNHNNNNHNSIFILNTTETSNILPNNPKLFYSDLNDNNNVVASSSSSSTSLASSSVSSTTASSSVWSSASSTMCSPAAYAIQKLFNCSSNSSKLNHGSGNCNGIDAITFKSNSELLKKKSKFWKYLEDEANDKSNQRGIDEAATVQKRASTAKSLKYKSKYWSKSPESDNQNQQDLSELLAYSCSLCDNCRCMDCQIGYFDCESSDDSNSEYSFHLSAYDEDDAAGNDVHSDNKTFCNRAMDMQTSDGTPKLLPTTYNDCCNKVDRSQHQSAVNEVNCTNDQCCQQCFIESTRDVSEGFGADENS